ncbi:TonB-dependent siderophore receptor [Erwinia rhapontici]|uniref:Ferric siderophore receptor n=1 Tax=Erwinia rhapontici TaxID=55212 RepID=A0ABM7MZ37_ERWRD|nr:TonB-dependent siderophore receptor [Erwinia rhapontici]BCQ34470.1 ferric siderophore receptor [Erwinia rhapontici]
MLNPEKNKVTMIAACISLALLPAAFPSFAQRADDEEKTLTVTADVDPEQNAGYVAKQSTTGSKTRTPVLATPQSLSVIGRDELTDRNVQTTTEALRYTPGVFTSTAAINTRFDYFSIRGFDATLNGALLDGLRSTTAQSYVRYQPYGMQSIDVLRGPAGFLYGSGSPGGVVNAISKRPTEQPLHEVGIQFGSHGRTQGQFDVGGPVNDDNSVLYRVVGVARDSNTPFENVKDDTLYLAPSMTWKPNTDTALTLLTSFSRDTFGPPRSYTPLQGTLLSNPNGKIPRNQYLDGSNLDNHMTQLNLGYDLDHRLNDNLSLHSTARYTRTELLTQTYSGMGLAADLRTLNRRAYEFGIKGAIIATDNNLKADWNAGPVKGTSVLGVSYRHTGEDYYLNYGSAPSVDIYNPVYGGRFAATTPFASTWQSADETGVYLSNTLALAESLLLDLSAREDWASVQTSNRLSNTDTSQNDHHFTWRAGLTWLTDSGLAPYVSYTTSFAPVLGTNFYGESYKPTTGKQIETGLKYQPESFDGLFTLAWFDLEQNNVSTTDPNQPLNTVQTGQITSKGIEASAAATLTPSFKLTASYTWNDLTTTKSNTAGAEGKTPVGMPEQMASVWGDYTQQQGPLASLGLGAGVRYVGKTWADTNNTIRVPDYTVFDAAVHYDLGQVNSSLKGARVAVNVNNLLNKNYYTTCSTTSCNQGYDRSVLATLSYRW